jgi:hypothetical protein
VARNAALRLQKSVLDLDNANLLQRDARRPGDVICSNWPTLNMEKRLKRGGKAVSRNVVVGARIFAQKHGDQIGRIFVYWVVVFIG